MDSYVIHLVGNNEDGTIIDEFVGLTGNFAKCQKWLRQNGFSKDGKIGEYWEKKGNSFVHHFHKNGEPLSGSPRATTLSAHIQHIRSFDVVAVRNHHNITPRDS